MTTTLEITVPYNFTPRPYQLPLLKAMDSGYLRAVQVWHRRSGKEKTDLAGVVSKKMLERVGAYYYVFPELAQGRKVVWDGSDYNGFRFIDHFPKELISGQINNSEMKLRYKNGSLFQVVGSDRFNSVMGTNPVGVVFSEYSLQDPSCWAFFRPILAENGGWAIFNFTPRGENHAYHLYELAKADPEHWFCQLLTVDDTGAIPKDVLERERNEITRLYGNDAFFRQEFYCDFSVPVPGAYYAHQISQAYKEGRVGKVPHDTRLPVHTWWDLGINDKMSIWFVQGIGQEIHVIDYYENSGYGLNHYANKLQEKGYTYGRHVAPHDIEVRELSNGNSRKEAAALLGISFEVAPRLSLEDGINAVRGIFSRLWFDADKCRDGLNALKNYHKVWDEKKKTYLDHPYHDWSSNASDAMRIGVVSYDVTAGMSKFVQESVGPESHAKMSSEYDPVRREEGVAA